LRLFTTKERPRGVLPLFYIPDHRHRFGADAWAEVWRPSATLRISAGGSAFSLPWAS